MKPGLHQAGFLRSVQEAAELEGVSLEAGAWPQRPEAALSGRRRPSFSLRKPVRLWLTHIFTIRGLGRELRTA